MAKAVYRLIKDDLDGIVKMSAEDLRIKFESGFPRGTEVRASQDTMRSGDLELPRTIEVEYKGRIHFPKTKLNKLYERN